MRALEPVTRALGIAPLLELDAARVVSDRELVDHVPGQREAALLQV